MLVVFLDIFVIKFLSYAVMEIRNLNHRTFGPVNGEDLQDRTRFYRTDNKIMIFF